MRGFGQFCALPDQFVAAAAQGTVDRSRNREHLPAQVERQPRGDQRTAAARRFDHQSAEAQGRDDRVPLRKIRRAEGECRAEMR